MAATGSSISDDKLSTVVSSGGLSSDPDQVDNFSSQAATIECEREREREQ